MRKILVAFDGSESAERAVEFAISLAKDNPPASFYLVIVHEEPVVYSVGLAYASYETLVAHEQARSAEVLAHAERLLREAGVAYTKEILMGPIASTIARRAEALGCDQIVMGTRGMGAIGNLTMGSVATKVVHAASVPVTLVKAGDQRDGARSSGTS